MATGTIKRQISTYNNMPSVTADILRILPTQADPYVFPGDGYISLFCNDSDHIGRIHVTGAGESNTYLQIGNNTGRFCLFVRKGMSCFLEGSTPNTARFVQLT